MARRLPRDCGSHDPSVPQPVNTRPTQLSVIQRLASESHSKAEFTIPYLSAPWEHPHPFGRRLVSSLPASSATRDERKVFVNETRRRIDASATDGGILCYTGGSKSVVQGCRRVGAGFVIERSGLEAQVGRAGLGPGSEVFDAEMVALALAAQAVRRMVLDPPPPSIVPGRQHRRRPVNH